MTIPTNPDTKLRRRDAAEALTQAGYPVKVATLNKIACTGGGPDYVIFGRTPLYRWGDLLAWAEARTHTPAKRKGTSDAR